MMRAPFYHALPALAFALSPLLLPAALPACTSLTEPPSPVPVTTETRVAHWYASVRTKPRVALVDPAYVRKNRNRQLYSALVCACVSDLPDDQSRGLPASVPPSTT